MTDFITLADDPDFAHLVDLIDILPRPGTKFWEEGGIGRKIASDLKPILAGQGRRRDVDYLAVHVLKYLGHSNTHIPQETITRNLRGVAGLPAAGQAWVDDATTHRVEARHAVQPAPLAGDPGTRLGMAGELTWTFRSSLTRHR
ncbi:hypothetical protein ABZ743_24555 [Streptomyces sp. NPDC006662]|uniref:hypothetical protein n=1 Tax=Streptomyces sp. NPDC006662 TaxID=3156902 RepID=UPI0034075B82